jgi:spore coat polysaccharide biosynthesis predicted glycosyltransferase SpsG
VIGFCIEASHERGLGHLYKTLNFVEYLDGLNERYIVMVNDDPTSTSILKQRGIPYVTVNLSDTQTDWETRIIRQYGITFWINDRLDTDIRHAQNVKKHRVQLVTFDDRGSGAKLADLHFAPLVFSGKEMLQGKRLLTGIHYLVLSRQIDSYKRLRDHIDSVLVTLGGSDTYGVTLLVVALVKMHYKNATVVVGPSFQHYSELEKITDGRVMVKRGVPSLIQEFVLHDLAITGGGVTPFEANASGLPCIIVANEPHEIEIGQYLAGVGSSVFAGYYQTMEKNVFGMELDLSAMSKTGIEKIGTDGAKNVFQEVKSL